MQDPVRRKVDLAADCCLGPLPATWARDMPWAFSRLAIGARDWPAAEASKMRRTTAASASLIVRRPPPGGAARIELTNHVVAIGDAARDAALAGTA